MRITQHDREGLRMGSKTADFAKQGLISPPKWLPDHVMYETIVGSVAYGVSNEWSDADIYGFCIPPKEVVFPHLAGEILGFGRQKKRFEQYQGHHITDGEKEYDITIFSIVKYFHLCMENNPNMIDSLFTPANCVLHATQVGQRVRENRRLFLHKGCWHKFKGYAYSQLHKMTSKNPAGKRQEIVEQFGYDLKFAYHTVRLISEVEQILSEGDLDLQRNREELKSIRRGEWTETAVKDYFARKETELEKVYHESQLPYSPDEERIKNLLLECLEEHYGSLDSCVVVPERAVTYLRGIQEIIAKATAAGLIS